MDEVDEFDACRGGDEALAVALDIVAFEECLDDACTRGRAPDAVFLHGSAQGLVLYELACCLHRPQQRGLVVVGRGRGPLLCECGLMVTTLSFHKGRKGALHPCVKLACLLLFLVIIVIVSLLLVFSLHHAPTRIENLLASDFELNGFSIISMNLSKNSCRGELTVWQEDTDEPAGDEVEYFLLGIAQILGHHACRDDSMVVCHLGGVEHTLRLLQGLAADGLDELRIGRYACKFSLV